jgi:hypothetical protein
VGCPNYLPLFGVFPASDAPTLSSGRCCEPTGHPVEPYWLSSAEIRSSTSYVNKMKIVIK